ncbi:MFS transporter [Paraburkholderia ginsengiterrae]|uniref:MFS transporter n=1 Tax=Paraburkholderia ginsengiterrae TaxID=1462993 RepID=A0A1A9N8U7_9BURK|nr:MFS transporter [Paraburkholderia ginsengiterrae]OAJ54916.1 MFS transporter [Paraburkholderia ginsengiterrae]OAJ61101.1 MFS transporter [Paraburkholderia ginsengiterrae]
MSDTAAVQSSRASARISPDMWCAAWTVTSVFMLSNSRTPLYVVWQRTLGFSSGTLTVIFALYILGLLGTLSVAGQLSDRYGRKPVLLPGILVALVACALFASATSIATLAVARLLTGIAVGVIVSAGMASVADLGGSERRRQAALLASVAMVLGAGLGPLLAGGAAQTVAHPVALVFGIEFLVLLSALVIAWRLPLGRPARATGNAARLHLPSVPAMNRRHVATGIGVFGPGITATSFVLALGPSLLARLLEVRSPLLAGGMACAMFLAATGVQFAVRRWSVLALFVAGTTATVLSMCALCAAVHLLSASVLVAAALFAGVAQGLGQLGGLTLIGLHVTDTRRAEAIAVMNIGGYLPAGLLPVMTGYAIDFLGLAAGATAFAIALALIALGAGCMVFRSLKPGGD